MQGREHEGVVWVQTAGLSELTDADEFRAAVQFRVADGFELEGGGSHVCVYETPEHDLAAVAANFVQPAIAVAAYRRMVQLGETAGKTLRGVVAVFTDCSDPGEEDAFNAWYEEHLRYVVENLGHYAVTRYVNEDLASGAPKYLAIYETENEDPGQLQRDGWKQYFEAEHKEEHAAPKSLVLRGEVALERLGS